MGIAPRVIGVDLGGTKIAAGVVDDAGTIFQSARIDTRAASSSSAA